MWTLWYLTVAILLFPTELLFKYKHVPMHTPMVKILLQEIEVVLL